MKKTALGLLAISACGLSAAQSTVTLYGVADVALSKTTGLATQLVSGATQNNGSSRWGMRGTEDLGGGLKAGFNFEAQVSLLNGAGGSNVFARAANMSLSGGFGTVNRPLKKSRATNHSNIGPLRTVHKRFFLSGQGVRTPEITAFRICTDFFNGLLRSAGP